LERRLDLLEASHPEVLAERITHMGKSVDALDADVTSLRRALYTFALSFIVGAVGLGVLIGQQAGF
jgi:ABC-type nitrate/sulfonate/bicarbonate transport system permease component